MDHALLTAVDPEVAKAALRHSSGKPLLCILTKGAQKRREMWNTIGGSEINCGLGDGKRSKAFQRALRAFEALVSDFAYQQIFLLCHCVILILLGSV